MCSAVYNCAWFESRSGQTKDYKIDINCFFTKQLHAALRIKSKDWLTLNYDNVSEWIETTDFCFH